MKCPRRDWANGGKEPTRVERNQVKRGATRVVAMAMPMVTPTGPPCEEGKSQEVATGNPWPWL